jgi:hypothetical protein
MRTKKVAGLSCGPRAPVRLREVVGDAPAGEGGLDPESKIRSGFRDLIVKAVDDFRLSIPQKLAKIEQLLKEMERDILAARSRPKTKTEGTEKTAKTQEGFLRRLLGPREFTRRLLEMKGR